MLSGKFLFYSIKIFDVSGYDEDGESAKDILTKTLDREDFWIKTC